MLESTHRNSPPFFVALILGLALTSCDDIWVTPIENEGFRIDATPYLGCYGIEDGDPIFRLESNKITNLVDNTIAPVMDFRKIKQTNLVFVEFEIKYDYARQRLSKERDIEGFRYPLTSDGNSATVKISSNLEPSSMITFNKKVCPSEAHSSSS